MEKGGNGEREGEEGKKEEGKREEGSRRLR